MGTRSPHEEDIVNCLHCRGTMRRAAAPFNIDRNGYHVLVDSVPAWICSQCGEPYFEEREVQVIQGAIRALDERAASVIAGHGASARQRD